MSYDIKGWLLSGADTFLVVKNKKKKIPQPRFYYSKLTILQDSL